MLWEQHFVFFMAWWRWPGDRRLGTRLCCVTIGQSFPSLDLIFGSVGCRARTTAVFHQVWFIALVFLGKLVDMASNKDGLWLNKFGKYCRKQNQSDIFPVGLSGPLVSQWASRISQREKNKAYAKHLNGWSPSCLLGSLLSPPLLGPDGPRTHPHPQILKETRVAWSCGFCWLSCD